MKKYLFLTWLMLMVNHAYADTKISAYSLDSSPVIQNLLVEVSDPSGTPTNHKITIGGLFTAANMTVTGTNVGIGSSSPRGILDIGTGSIYGDGSHLTGVATGGWTDGGTTVYPTTLTDNIGIGTSSATQRFQIVSPNTTTIPWMNITDSSLTWGLALSSGRSGTTVTPPTIGWNNGTDLRFARGITDFSGNTTGASIMATLTNAGHLVMASGGNIGIGSATPGAALDIFSGTVRLVGIGTTTAGTLSCYKADGRLGYCTGSLTNSICGTCN